MGIVLSLCGERNNYGPAPAVLPWLPGCKPHQEGLPVTSSSHKLSRRWQEGLPAPTWGLSQLAGPCSVAKTFSFCLNCKETEYKKSRKHRNQDQAFFSMRLERLGDSGTADPFYLWLQLASCDTWHPVTLAQALHQHSFTQNLFSENSKFFLVILLQVHWMKFCQQVKRTLSEKTFIIYLIWFIHPGKLQVQSPTYFLVRMWALSRSKWKEKLWLGPVNMNSNNLVSEVIYDLPVWLLTSLGQIKTVTDCLARCLRMWGRERYL